MEAIAREDIIGLLKDLIRTPSFSKEEEYSASLVERFLSSYGVRTLRKQHNIWAYNRYFDVAKPTILLNSHHDTVKPNPGYTRDPFHPDIEGDKLYGLGSNDAGGCLVALIATFLHFYQEKDLAYNLCLAATAEEEISGRNGIALILPELINLSFAIVGEPTSLDLAIAEKGLIVLDCTATGASGHAAREEGVNAIYKALDDIQWFRNYRFPKGSELFGAVKMSVTVINAGAQHNVVPALCQFVVDVRVTDAYTNLEVLEIIRSHVSCQVSPRSLRLSPSSIPPDHPIVKAGIALGRKTYGSPTMSDQALLSIPSLKLGPGASARSHSADEYVYLSEIQSGADLYINLLKQVL